MHERWHTISKWSDRAETLRMQCLGVGYTSAKSSARWRHFWDQRSTFFNLIFERCVICHSIEHQKLCKCTYFHHDWASYDAARLKILICIWSFTLRASFLHIFVSIFGFSRVDLHVNFFFRDLISGPIVVKFAFEVRPGGSRVRIRSVTRFLPIDFSTAFDVSKLKAYIEGVLIACCSLNTHFQARRRGYVKSRVRIR